MPLLRETEVRPRKSHHPKTLQPSIFKLLIQKRLKICQILLRSVDVTTEEVCDALQEGKFQLFFPFSSFFMPLKKWGKNIGWLVNF